MIDAVPFSLDVAFPTGAGGTFPFAHVSVTGVLNGTLTGNGFSDVLLALHLDLAERQHPLAVPR